MKDAAVCLFAWDLCDEGIEQVLEHIAALGVTSLFLAATYHAGWFVLPHNPRRKCLMSEDGAAYFHPRRSFYESAPLKPRVARIAAQTDWFAAVGERLDRYGLRLTAWTVCNHNTPLGLLYPEHTVRNACGDGYPHALCPASGAVRAYVRGLAADLASHYPLQSIFLESPNYRGRRHGHHHERELITIGPLENALLDLSFSEHDMAAAACVDAEKLRRAVCKHLEQFFAASPERPRGCPETMEQFIAANPALADYTAVLNERVSSLVAEVKSDLRPFNVELEGVENCEAYDVRVVGAYGRRPEEVARLTREAKSQLAPHQRLRVGFRLGGDPPGAEPVIGGPEQARECVQAALENGATDIFFYNYSESPQKSLNWIRHAIS